MKILSTDQLNYKFLCLAKKKKTTDFSAYSLFQTRNIYFVVNPLIYIFCPYKPFIPTLQIAILNICGIFVRFYFILFYLLNYNECFFSLSSLEIWVVCNYASQVCTKQVLTDLWKSNLTNLQDEKQNTNSKH